MRAQLKQRARRTYDLLAELVRSDILIRYGRGRIRVLKWLLDPIAALGVYLLLVALVLDQGEQAIGLSLVCAIIPFQLVVATVINSFQAVGLRSSIILNMEFPRGLIPVSAVVTETVVLTASLVLIPIMMAAYGVGPTGALVWLPLAFAVTIVFSLALAYPAALFGVWYPEMMPFCVSLVRAMFFLAPGLVALDLIFGKTHDVIMVNPLTGIFETFRDALLYGQAPSAWQLLVPLAASAVILAVCVPLYRAEQAHFAKLIG